VPAQEDRGGAVRGHPRVHRLQHLRLGRLHDRADPLYAEPEHGGGVATRLASGADSAEGRRRPRVGGGGRPGRAGGGHEARGPRVVLFDDDHYSMGGALAEQLQKGGSQVTYVTSAAGVSQWTQHTMEQPRIQRRLLELSVTIRTSHALISAAAGGATLTCAYT